MSEEPMNEEPWWLPVLGGLIMLGGSVWVYFDLTSFEAEGGTRRINVLVNVIYDFAGKWGVVGLMAIGGAGALWAGLCQLSEQSREPEKK